MTSVELKEVFKISSAGFENAFRAIDPVAPNRSHEITAIPISFRVEEVPQLFVARTLTVSPLVKLHRTA